MSIRADVAGKPRAFVEGMTKSAKEEHEQRNDEICDNSGRGETMTGDAACGDDDLIEGLRGFRWALGYETILLARRCAADALDQGAPARELGSQEDCSEGDYDALDELLSRPATERDLSIFREAYSRALARGAS